MKRFWTPILFLVVGILAIGFANVSAQTEMDKSKFEILIDGPAKLDKKGTIKIGGKGFQPDSEIVLLFHSAEGIKSDLSGSVKPAPVADSTGTWETTWSYGRLVKKKIIKAGDYNIDVVNEDYEKLTSFTVTFVK